MYKRTAIATALLLCTFTAAANLDAGANKTSSDPCAPAAAAQQGADAAIRKAEEEAEKFGEDILAASDLLEKCIGSFSLAGFSLNLFSDLGFSSILERLKKEVCSIASDHLGDAADFLNDQIDNTIWDIIGGAQAAIGNIPGASQIVPSPTIQTPGINYNKPSGSSGSLSSSSSKSSDPSTTAYTDPVGTIFTPADPSTGTPATLTYTDNWNGKQTTITEANLPAGAYTYDAGNGRIAIFTPNNNPHEDNVGRITYPGAGDGGVLVSGNSAPKPDGRMYSSTPSPWAGVKKINENASSDSSSDTSSSWWSNIWK